MLTNLLFALNKNKPLTLDELAAAAGASAADVLRALHCETEAWWHVEQVPGSAGWLYRKRQMPAPVAPFVRDFAMKDGI